MELQKRNSGGCSKQEDRREQMGGPVHSQVRKIKRESEKIFDWSPGQPEMRPFFRDMTRHAISRSPLGLSGRAISVGDL